MIIEQRLYQILSPVVAQLYPISAPVGTDPAYTIYRFISEEPFTTQNGTVIDLRRHCIEFVSFGSPGAQYADIAGRTETIMSTLLPFRDSGIQSITLKNRQTHYDTHYKMDANLVEFEVIESLSA